MTQCLSWLFQYGGSTKVLYSLYIKQPSTGITYLTTALFQSTVLKVLRELYKHTMDAVKRLKYHRDILLRL